MNIFKYFDPLTVLFLSAWSCSSCGRNIELTSFNNKVNDNTVPLSTSTPISSPASDTIPSINIETENLETLKLWFDTGVSSYREQAKEGLKGCDKYLKDHATITYNVIHEGREGEVAYCIQLKNMEKPEKDKVAKEIFALVKGNQGVHITENARCATLNILRK